MLRSDCVVVEPVGFLIRQHERLPRSLRQRRRQFWYLGRHQRASEAPPNLSSFSRRVMSSCTAAGGGLPSYSISYTAVMIGVSSSVRRLRSCTLLLVVTPSATCGPAS